mmetsp:Transcript_42335/g.133572  ORF Transcript_42335/g.133572 Transcript_42335/m.133572 type:complete len:210 (-) Transcript_42335:1291-1920(-)
MSMRGSVACVASSTSTTGKCRPATASSLQPASVEHTTSAPSRISAIVSPSNLRKSFLKAVALSAAAWNSSFAGAPSRTACTPSFSRPASIWSTATWESATARRGPRFLDTAFKKLQAVKVFPQPGGPWIRPIRLFNRLAMASRWGSFKCSSSRQSISSSSSSLLSSSMSPAPTKTRRTCFAKNLSLFANCCTARSVRSYTILFTPRSRR